VGRELARLEPQSGLEKVEDWAALSDEARRLRAAEAVRDADRAALFSLLEAHLRAFSRKGLRTSVHTFDSYRRGLEALLDWSELHALKIHQLRRQDALRFRAYLEERGGHDRRGEPCPLAPPSVNARLSAVRCMMQALMWAGLMEADPFAKISIHDPQKPEDKRRPYTRAELAALEKVADRRELALLLLGADAGLRVSEACGLTWGDVDAEARRVTVRFGKGGRTAMVGMTERCAAALAELKLSEASGEQLDPPHSVFGIGRRRALAILERLCRRAGVTCRGFHALRHSAGTRLYEATRDIKLVARHLRHAQLETASIYAKLADTDYLAAVERLG